MASLAGWQRAFISIDGRAIHATQGRKNFRTISIVFLTEQTVMPDPLRKKKKAIGVSAINPVCCKKVYISTIETDFSYQRIQIEFLNDFKK